MPARRSLQGIIGDNATTSLLKGQASNITTQLGALPAFTSAVTPAGSGGTTPQAWLTILFFDERFNFITAADGGLAQQQVASSVTGAGATLGPLTIKAPKNGYVFIYVSNRSDQDVYFDNLNVSIAASNIIEENHYYAYGLKIATISSKKLGDTYEGTLDNKYLYNDKELFDDADLNWYDYGFRNYDPQIGRFMQLDPLTFNYPSLTPYQYSGDEPISNVDVDGLEPVNVLSFIDRINSLGGSVNSVRFLTVGKNAGQWVVGYGLNGAAHSTLFVSKTVGNLARTATIGVIKVTTQMAVDKLAHKPLTFYNNSSNRPITNDDRNFLSRFMEALDRFAMGSGGVNLAAGTSLMKEPREGDKSLNIDVSGMTADYKDIIDHADEFLEMLSAGGGPEKGLAGQVINKNIPKAERVNAFIELVSHAFKEGSSWGEKIYKAIEKFKEVREEKEVKKVFKTPGRRIYRRDGKFTTEVIDTSGGGQITSKPATDTFPLKSHN